MIEPTATPHASSDGLWRWLVGGLVAGGVILGLLIAAYAVGYHHGRHHARVAASTAPATMPTAPTTTAAVATTSAPTPTAAPVPVTAALVAQGKSLYERDGCSACHSLSGSTGAGPSFKGLAGSTVTLTTGQSTTADDAYLERSIADPDAQIVKSYHPGIMSTAIAGYGLASKPDDIRALVAFIKSQK